MQSEAEIQREIQLALSGVIGLRLWRGNVAKGWMGLPKDTSTMNEDDGSTTVIIRNARRLDTHLPAGFSDLFGFLGANGQCIPVFIECKSVKGRPTPEQRLFITAMQAAGCLAGFARSVEDAKKILQGEKLL